MNRNDVQRNWMTVSWTILSMMLYTKWWHAVPVDGPDRYYWGFPFAFIGEGFHTSMSYQIFILEFLADVFIHFIIWYFIMKGIQMKYPDIRFYQWFRITTHSLSILLSLLFVLYISISEPVIHLKRYYDWKIISQGFKFIWEQTPI